MTYRIEVNGTKRIVEAEADMPLLWVLRDLLNLKGSKYGCGIGSCGACTVHLDGQPVRSCTIQISRVGASKVTTIEAIGDTALGSRVQQAWLDVDVAQCGYCQPAQIMSATALLVKIPHPTDHDIDRAMAGVICRCCTYPRIRAAIKKAAGLSTADVRTP